VHGNEPSDSIKYSEIHEKLEQNWWLLKQDSAHRVSQLTEK
jgi:hypothetical protein